VERATDFVVGGERSHDEFNQRRDVVWQTGDEVLIVLTLNQRRGVNFPGVLARVVEIIERRMLGQAGMVKLWPAGDELVVGEGLETVLAAATRIPYRGAPLIPAWAALSTVGLRALPIIPRVQRLIILSDNDSNQEGQMAAAVTALRWRAAGRAVVTLTPPTPDSDFNDLVLREDAYAADPA
jgi:hypothetical protein